MKKRIKSVLVSLGLIGAVAYGNSPSLSAKFGICTTQNDALNMMIASQVYGNTLMVDYRNKNRIYEKAYHDYKSRKLKDSKAWDEVERLNVQRNKASSLWSNYVEETGKLGRTTHEGRFQEACDTYIALSKKYGGDIEKDYQTTIRIDASKETSSIDAASCGLGEASVVLMVFLEEAGKHQSLKTKEVEGLIDSAGLDVIRDPNKVCEKVAMAAEKMHISYERILHTAQGIMAKNKEKMRTKEAIQKKNAASNKLCTQHDMVTLVYKERDLGKRFLALEQAWHDRASEARAAKLQDSKRITLLRAKKQEISDLVHQLDKEFDQAVEKEGEALGKYDLACTHYQKLEKKYVEILAQRQKEFDTFDAKKSLQNTQKTPTGNTQADKYAEGEKYNYFVQLINQVTPQMRDAFKSYATECGTNKEKRVHARVEEAVRMAGGKNRDVYERSYGYHITRSFSQDDIENIAALCDAILANKSYPEADKIIKQYKTHVADYMRRYNEAAEYYNMKDYMDDKFQKADALHRPIVEDYEQIVALDQGLRSIVNEISDRQSLARIAAYKKSGQLVFFHVAKAQFVSKKFYEYASHKEDYMQLDLKILRAKVDELRDFYKIFKQYAHENKNVFDDNGQYRTYLETFHEYVLRSRALYVRVKSKKRYDMDEEVLMHIPKAARAAMVGNMEGTLTRLLRQYNRLVDRYNGLDM